ncbi:MAG: copper oxidase [Anaerolineales bacterium]|nr:copper oxidase [Anaerolineae bacterium]PWB70272.1 MAG: copper oxidase [Anaerolineales bacterium]
MLRAYGAFAGPQTALPGSALPQFVDELPLLNSHVAGSAIQLVPGFSGPITDPQAGSLTIRMEEFKANVMPTGFAPVPTPANPAPAPYAGTWVWGYQAAGFETNPGGVTAPTYINPVVLAFRGKPTRITWVNNLPDTNFTETAWATWTDQTLHWADPLNEMMNHPMTNYKGPVPAVPHLHGGEVPPQLDGGPDAWFTADGLYQGHAYWPGIGGGGNTSVYNYPNSQEAAPIWFHDHALGITRINVYAGIAGAYLLLDPANPWPIDPTRIIPMVIQDRMFDTNGQLYFPAGPPFSPNPMDHPFWVPEFEGDVICVNGKVWPKLTVSNKRYAFWFLNGSNARTYDMFLIDQVSKNFGPPIWIIGTDGGLLDTPVKLDPLAPKPLPNSLTMMPGERYLAIIDFSGYEAGVVGPNGAAFSGSWLLKNNAKTPFPAGVAPNGTTTGRVIQFVVNPAGTLPDEAYNPAVGGQLRAPMVRLANAATGTPGAGVTINKIRQLTLNEVMGMLGPLEALVNNTKWNGKSVATDVFPGGIRPDFTVGPDGETYYSELPQEGETELWEIVNLTADAHPIHTHLVQFQLMNRQNFNVNKYSGAYNALFPASSAIDPMTGLPYPGGVFIGGYGPPLPVNGSDPRSNGKLGGNPDIGALKGKNPLYLQGPAMPPLPQEAGWKDTVIMYPGQVTRIMVRWAPTDLPANTPAANAWFPFDPNGGHGYVWHCHIIDHEDNEMMRPDAVKPNPSPNVTRTFTDY